MKQFYLLFLFIISLSFVSCGNDSDEPYTEEETTEYKVKFNISSYSQEVVPIEGLVTKEGSDLSYFTTMSASFKNIENQNFEYVFYKPNYNGEDIEILFRPGKYKGIIEGIVGMNSPLFTQDRARYTFQIYPSIIDASTSRDIQYDVVEFEVNEDLEININLHRVPCLQIQYINTDVKFPDDVSSIRVLLRINKPDSYFPETQEFSTDNYFSEINFNLSKGESGVPYYIYTDRDCTVNIELYENIINGTPRLVKTLENINVTAGKKTIIKSSIYDGNGEINHNGKLNITYDDTQKNWNSDAIIKEIP